MNLNDTTFHWLSDWNGYEVGYPNIDVVGLYSFKLNGVSMNAYVNIETFEVLEKWPDELTGDES